MQKAAQRLSVFVTSLALLFAGAWAGSRVAESRWDASHRSGQPADTNPQDTRDKASTNGAVVGIVAGSALSALLAWAVFRQRPYEEVAQVGTELYTVIHADQTAGEYPGAAKDRVIHERIITAGLAPAGLFLGAGVIGLMRGWNRLPAGNDPAGAHLHWQLITSYLAVFGVGALVCFAFGTGIALLFAPTRFLYGPIGQRWMKYIGVQTVFKARLVCLLILGLAVAVGRVILLEILKRLS